MMSNRSNVTAKLPIMVRALKASSGERPSVRPPTRAGALPFAPRVVGRYLLCDVFASGGMATLHLGRLMGPEGFSRTVAIKQLHPQYAHDPKFVAMFLDEARLASRVHHPNVVSPLDVISHPPDLFMVMDYVHGEPLSRLLKRHAGEPVPPRIAAAIVGQVLLGLHAAHEATGESGEPLELVHRDVTPHNIMVTKDGVAKVVDFGIAKAKARSAQTERGMLKGKLGYMSPEQINQETVDRRVDVFAVGVVLWEMLTGQRLFDGDNPGDVLQKLMERPIPAPNTIVPSLPADLNEVVVAALARSTDERFANARAMAQALDYATPTASMLELAAWVEERAGDDLSARAELVLDVEALRFDDFTRGHALSPPTHPVLVQAAESPHESVEPSSLSVREPSQTARRRRWLLLPAAGLFVGAAALLLFFGNDWRSAPTVAGPSVIALPTPPANDAARSPDSPPAVDPIPVAEPAGVAKPAGAEKPAAVAKPHVVEPAAADVAEPAAAPAARRTPVPKPAVDAAALAAVSARPLAKTAPGPCDVPYTIDKQGVKRFKEACF